MTRFHEEAQQALKEEAAPEGLVNAFRATVPECLGSGLNYRRWRRGNSTWLGSIHSGFRCRLWKIPSKSRSTGSGPLAPHQPYLRGAPPELPFGWDTATLERGLNFTLTTRLGDLA